jgi:hypothetical protein
MRSNDRTESRSSTLTHRKPRYFRSFLVRGCSARDSFVKELLAFYLEAAAAFHGGPPLGADPRSHSISIPAVQSFNQQEFFILLNFVFRYKCRPGIERRTAWGPSFSAVPETAGYRWQIPVGRRRAGAWARWGPLRRGPPRLPTVETNSPTVSGPERDHSRGTLKPPRLRENLTRDRAQRGLRNTLGRVSADHPHDDPLHVLTRVGQGVDVLLAVSPGHDEAGEPEQG